MFWWEFNVNQKKLTRKKIRRLEVTRKSVPSGVTQKSGTTGKTTFQNRQVNRKKKKCCEERKKFHQTKGMHIKTAPRRHLAHFSFSLLLLFAYRSSAIQAQGGSDHRCVLRAPRTWSKLKTFFFSLFMDFLFFSVWPVRWCAREVFNFFAIEINKLGPAGAGAEVKWVLQIAEWLILGRRGRCQLVGETFAMTSDTSSAARPTVTLIELGLINYFEPVATPHKSWFKCLALTES